MSYIKTVTCPDGASYYTDKRFYRVSAYTHGYRRVEPVPRSVTSRSRARAAGCELFRRIFGREATESFHCGDGLWIFRNRRREVLNLEQHNWGHPCYRRFAAPITDPARLLGWSA